MILAKNKVREAFEQKRPCYGLYMMTPSTRLIEYFAGAGMDFIRIDLVSGVMTDETLRDLIHTAHAVGITPFVRAKGPSDPRIKTALHLGALGIIIPDVENAQQVKDAIRVVKGPPHGERDYRPMQPTGGFGKVSTEEYQEWARRNIILSTQIETKSGVEAIDEIVALEGLDMVQSGRGDLSRHYGTPGNQYSEPVLAAERRVMEAGLKAGKMASVQYYPMTREEDYQHVKDWLARGVYCLSLGTDIDIVLTYRKMLTRLKG